MIDLNFPFYLLVTSGYLVVTCGYLVVASGYLIATIACDRASFLIEHFCTAVSDTRSTC